MAMSVTGGRPDEVAADPAGEPPPPPEPPIREPDPGGAVREWFARLGRHCAAVDYAAARRIVAPDVVGFGTRAAIVSGREALQAEQWQGVWPNIEGFQFDLDGLRARGDGRLAWGVATWTSTGFDERGQAFHRPGRATVVLERREDTWLAVHTHFSVSPGTPSRTHGPRGDTR